MKSKGDFVPARTNWVYYLTRGIARLIFRLFFRLRCYGCENVPAEGAVILAANHTSFLDPPLTAVGVKRPLRYVARKTLWGENRIWNKFLDGCNAFPVDQEKPDVGSFKVMLRLLHAGEGLVLFPEGSRSWDGALLEPKPGVARLACRTEAPVVPVFIEGAYMALPRGKKFMRPCRIRVYYGQPTTYTDVGPGQDKNEHYRRVSDHIMQRIAELGGLEPLRRSGDPVQEDA